MITVALLAALGQTEELRAHLAGAANVGISREELVEVLMHVSIYAGVPAAGAALRGRRRRPRHRRADLTSYARLERLSGFQRSVTSACCSATATSSLQSAPPSPRVDRAASSTPWTAAPTGVGTPSASPVSTMSPASFAASSSANCVGPAALVDVSTCGRGRSCDAPAGAQDLDRLLHADAGLGRHAPAPRG